MDHKDDRWEIFTFFFCVVERIKTKKKCFNLETQRINNKDNKKGSNWQFSEQLNTICTKCTKYRKKKHKKNCSKCNGNAVARVTKATRARKCKNCSIYGKRNMCYALHWASVTNVTLPSPCNSTRIVVFMGLLG